jgi:integrase
VRSVIWRKKSQGFDAAAGQVRGLLKRMFDYALTCGLIQANPVMALPMRHVYRAAARDRALTPDEIRRFLRAMQSSNIRRQFKIAFQLILMTLVRKSELMLAQWKDVHLDEGEWHIPVENSKTGKPHIVYLSTQAQMLFKELAAGQQQRLGVAGPWHPGQALRQQCTESGAEGVIAGAGDPGLHHPRPATHRIDAAARTGLAFGCGGKGAEPHHRRCAWCLQPGRVRRTAAGDVAGVVGLHRRAGAVGESGDRCRLDVTVAFSFSG